MRIQASESVIHIVELTQDEFDTMAKAWRAIGGNITNADWFGTPCEVFHDRLTGFVAAWFHIVTKGE
jgi:hypothetical protein